MKELLVTVVSIVLFLGFCAILPAQTIPAEELGEIYVRATRLAQSDYKIAGNVKVIDREEIESTNATNIPDLLKETSGIFVYDQSTAKSATVDIRGFGDTAKRNILVLVNDRKINSVDQSGADLTQIPIEEVERIEIIRGAGSVLYGDNAVGGVINIITKKGKGEMKGRLGAFYGSYDKQGSDIELSGEAKNISYNFYSKYMDDRGFRENSDVLYKDFNTRLGYKLSPKISFDFEVGRHQDKTQLPGGLSSSELATLGRRGSADKTDYSKTRDMFYNLSFDLKPWAQEVDFGTFIVDLTNRKRNVFDSFFSNFWETKRDIETNGITAKYIFNKPIFSKEVNFVTGIDFYDTDNHIKGFTGNTDDIVITKKETGAYGFLEYELFDKIFVNGGSRFQQAEYNFDNIGARTYHSNSPDEWASMGGFRYEYAPKSSLHFNAQQTFRFLSTDEWYSTWPTPSLNTSLKQQTGIQFETGIKHNYQDKVTVNITPYAMLLNDEIYYDPSTYKNLNYDKTRRLGVELGVEADILKFVEIKGLEKLDYFINYTYQKPQFKEGAYENKYIPLVPRDQVSSGISAGFGKFYNISFIGNFVGSRYIINDLSNNFPKAKPYFVVDAKLSYKREYLEVYAKINNLFDRQYFTYESTNGVSVDYFPAPERNFMVGIDLKF
ncbi:MAG: TonB-dependent receptor [Candidatus Omnitrophica bacterium]|nr:TonB-dependent receptor [Candidatus Omnitrophota bacterium]